MNLLLISYYHSAYAWFITNCSVQYNAIYLVCVCMCVCQRQIKEETRWWMWSLFMRSHHRTVQDGGHVTLQAGQWRWPCEAEQNRTVPADLTCACQHHSWTLRFTVWYTTPMSAQAMDWKQSYLPCDLFTRSLRGMHTGVWV